MSFNLHNIGKPIALIKSDKKTKYKNTIISLNEDDSDSDEEMLNKTSFSNLKIKDGNFMYVFDPKFGFRTTHYICGANGSGKSFYLASYIKDSFYKYFPKDYPIYLFSEKEEDEAFTGITMKKIKIDKELVTDPLNFNDFANSLVIFDDVDAITGDIGKAIVELRDKILKNGRSIKISCIITNHTFTDGKYTKSMLNECECITFFFRNYNRSLKYLLENYIGLNKDAINILKGAKSRATTYVKSYPNVIIQEKAIYTINSLIKE
jgi:hypothetical protein